MFADRVKELVARAAEAKRKTQGFRVLVDIVKPLASEIPEPMLFDFAV